MIAARTADASVPAISTKRMMMAVVIQNVFLRENHLPKTAATAMTRIVMLYPERATMCVVPESAI